MSWYTPYCPKLTLMSYRPARLLASDLFPDFPVQIFSKISLSVACRFRIHTTEDCIFVSSHSNKPGKVRVWRKCVGLTGLFPTCHGGQLTLKLWVTKQGFHPGVYYMNNMFQGRHRISNFGTQTNFAHTPHTVHPLCIVHVSLLTYKRFLINRTLGIKGFFSTATLSIKIP